jgi:hypothetical protein
MSEDYNKLIFEAFIDPIRSVMIVDDDYPTLDEILGTAVDGKVDPKHENKAWRDNPSDVLSVVREFRQPHGGPYILDIHDGDMPPPGTDEHQAHRLQQTDLLVLDYELNGKVSDGGAKALAIARKALTNDHFNIILLHTRETLDDVFLSFLFSLLRPQFDPVGDDITEEQEAVLDEHLSTAADLIGDAAYLELRNSSKGFEALMQSKSGPTIPVRDYLNTAVLEVHWDFVLRAAASEFERIATQNGRFSDNELGVRAWHDQDCFWIRCDQGFIAFKQKGDGVPLLETLKNTLVSWGPFPSRLLLTKMRAIMNEKGIEVQDNALGDRAVGAAWYHHLVKTEAPERSIQVEQVVRNHSEQLLDQLMPGIAEYAEKLASAHGTDANEAVDKAFDGFDMGDETTRHRAITGQNAFVASKPIGGFHLEFGHILEINEFFWICLTPACDMSPIVRRNRGIEPDDLEGHKRFVALRLHDVPIKGALKNAQRAEHVFVNLAQKNGGTRATAFALARAPKTAPAIMTMYAENDGKFSPDKPELQVRYVDTHEVQGVEIASQEFVFANYRARVCGHLRYEYALHIQAMYADQQSRIGLDYVGSN